MSLKYQGLIERGPVNNFDYCFWRAEDMINNLKELGSLSKKMLRLKKYLSFYETQRTVLNDLVRKEGMEKESAEEKVGTDFLEIEFALPLVKALLATFEYLALLEEERSLSKKGAETHADFFIFFREAFQNLNFSSEETEKIFYLIFSPDFFRQDFKQLSSSEDDLEMAFTEGVFGEMKAFDFLRSSEAFSKAEFFIPTEIDDQENKVDLVAKTAKELSLFQIKGLKRGERAKIYDLFNPLEREEIEDKIQVVSSRSGRAEKLISDIRKIIAYAEKKQQEFKERGREVKVKAYWVQVERVKGF